MCAGGSEENWGSLGQWAKNLEEKGTSVCSVKGGGIQPPRVSG